MIFSHTQLADDTMLFCKPKASNVKAIKSLLLNFELISGLKVNFQKSKMSGINVDDERLSQ